ncbi:hypothetical protein K458DRAFT_40486 [Lentithecium fluviatile CBS 122367]|uniref:Uncharacterized protein n=1 Tax=Lentithecium fluviatile CBS 122367 TaxID=1168545 RepID=A0A6G1IZH5_9PLEO|nr:hypothetical protein K458DRAFT_40486 [Lentithecium fluviatile CBS 122367]
MSLTTFSISPAHTVSTTSGARTFRVAMVRALGLAQPASGVPAGACGGRTLWDRFCDPGLSLSVAKCGSFIAQRWLGSEWVWTRGCRLRLLAPVFEGRVVWRYCKR